MTEGDHVKASTGGELSSLEKDIVKQMSYYFGDFNLPRDKFLQEQLKENKEGWIDMSVMLKFQRLSKLSSDPDVILQAMKKAGDNMIEVDLENKKVRRNPELPLPEEEGEEARKAKTVYCKGFEKEATSLDDLLAFFNKYEGVIHVNRRTYPDRKDNTRHFKGSVFVTFKEKANAEAFLAMESVKNPEGEELVRKWQAAYFEEKLAERKAKKESGKKAPSKGNDDNGTVAAAVAEEEPAKALPKGAVLFMDGFKNDTMREDIKAVLKDQFDVAHDAIAFIDFEKGQTSAHVRFNEESAAKELADKIREKLGDAEKLKVKEADISLRVLESEEEDKYLEKAASDMKLRKEKSKGHKRRHHGGGRGGGRGGKRGRY